VNCLRVNILHSKGIGTVFRSASPGKTFLANHGAKPGAAAAGRFRQKYKSLITLPHAAGICQALLRCSLALSATAEGALET